MYRITVEAREDHPKLGALTTFDDVEPLSPVFFFISDQGLDLSEARLGTILKSACLAIKENRSFSAAQITLNDSIK